jgi:hypothetical protein
MTGILERIEGKLDALAAQLGAQPSQVAPVQQFAPPAIGMDFPTTTAPPPITAQLTPATGQYPVASAEQITALITPYVENPHIKAALQAQMAAMGIGALPDAQPHQYGELYARFQGVIQQAQAAPPPPQGAAPPSSII